MWLQKYKYWVLGSGLCLLLLLGGWFVGGLLDNARKQAIAEEQEKNAKILAQQQAENQKKFDALMAESQRQMQQMAQQQAQLVQAALLRSQQFQGTVGDIRSKTSAEDVVKQFKEYLNITATTPALGYVTLPAVQAQNLLIAEEENKKLKLDLMDKEKELLLEKQKRELVQKQLEEALIRIDEQKLLVAKWEEVSKSWKSAAKTSKWRKVWDFAKPVGVAIVAGVIAGQVAK